MGRKTSRKPNPTRHHLRQLNDFKMGKIPRSSEKELGCFDGATLEQHKDGSELISATEATTWIEFAAA
jgi:hypothetical protein